MVKAVNPRTGKEHTWKQVPPNIDELLKAEGLIKIEMIETINKRTVDSVLSDMKDWVENRKPTGPHMWLEAAQTLNLLIEDEQDDMYRHEHNLATKKANLMSKPDMTAAKANIVIEADKEYLEYKLSKAKVGRVQEFIRIAKAQSRIALDNERR